MFAQFSLGACSRIINRFNIMGHFVGWKFCSRGWIIPMKSLILMKGLCRLQERAPGACSGSEARRVCRP